MLKYDPNNNKGIVVLSLIIAFSIGGSVAFLIACIWFSIFDHEEQTFETDR